MLNNMTRHLAFIFAACICDRKVFCAFSVHLRVLLLACCRPVSICYIIWIS